MSNTLFFLCVCVCVCVYSTNAIRGYEQGQFWGRWDNATLDPIYNIKDFLCVRVIVIKVSLLVNHFRFQYQFGKFRCY